MRATAPGQSALLLLDVVNILNAEHFDYAVIGAFALSVHGHVRASMDVDALLSVPFRRLKRLEGVFRKAGFQTSLSGGDPEDSVQGLLKLRDAHGNQVDLLGGLARMDPRLFDRTLEVPFQGATLRFAGREDFIAMKCFADGPQDLLDATEAYKSAQAPLNLDLLRTLTRRFGRKAADRLESILNSST